MKRILLMVAAFLLLAFFQVKAQYNAKENNIWAFGNGCGLDFSSGSPVSIRTNMSGIWGNATLCDANGQLLFYTDGDTVWNKNGDIMPNAGGLLYPGAFSPYNWWNTAADGIQGSLIVPVLNNPNQYYIFSLSGSTLLFRLFDTHIFRLNYSIIDMTLDNGKGDVVPGKKGIVIDSLLGGQIIAVPGKDCNIWVLVHEMNTTKFKAYEITHAGINTTPVISVAGNLTAPYLDSVALPTNGLYLSGVMKISPNYKKLVLNSYNLLTYNGAYTSGAELFDFDQATGTVTNPVYIDSFDQCYGACFSPDNSKLYINYSNGGVFTNLFEQFDLSLPTTAAIINSKTVFGPFTNGDWGTDLKLGPDGKIYFNANNKDSIGTIDFPNLAGAACHFNANAIKVLNRGLYILDVLDYQFPPVQTFWRSFGLPNDYVKPLLPDTLNGTVSIDTIACHDGNLTLKARTGFSSYVWNDQTTTNDVTVTQPGKYWVLCNDDCHSYIDTFVVIPSTLPFAQINVNGSILSTTGAYQSYQWYLNGILIPNATNATYTVHENGVYSVKVVSAGGCTDSVSYTVSHVSVTSLAHIAGDITIYPNPANDVLHISSPVAVDITIHSLDGKLLLQEKKAKNVNISSIANGLYFITITDEKGATIKVDKFIKVSK